MKSTIKSNMVNMSFDDRKKISLNDLMHERQVIPISLFNSGSIKDGIDKAREYFREKGEGTVDIPANGKYSSVQVRVRRNVRNNEFIDNFIFSSYRYPISTEVRPYTGEEFQVGDIVINTDIVTNPCFGWICTKSGPVSSWENFGNIKKWNTQIEEVTSLPDASEIQLGRQLLLSSETGESKGVFYCLKVDNEYKWIQQDMSIGTEAERPEKPYDNWWYFNTTIGFPQWYDEHLNGVGGWRTIYDKDTYESMWRELSSGIFDEVDRRLDEICERQYKELDFKTGEAIESINALKSDAISEINTTMEGFRENAGQDIEDKRNEALASIDSALSEYNANADEKLKDFNDNAELVKGNFTTEIDNRLDESLTRYEETVDIIEADAQSKYDTLFENITQNYNEMIQDPVNTYLNTHPLMINQRYNVVNASNVDSSLDADGNRIYNVLEIEDGNVNSLAMLPESFILCLGVNADSSTKLNYINMLGKSYRVVNMAGSDVVVMRENTRVFVMITKNSDVCTLGVAEVYDFVRPATVDKLGAVMPDGDTIEVDENGKISSKFKVSETAIEFNEETGEGGSDENIKSGELLPKLFGKIMHLFNKSTTYEESTNTTSDDISSGILVQLKRFFTGKKLFPKTTTKAVYRDDGTNLDDELNSIQKVKTDMQDHVVNRSMHILRDDLGVYIEIEDDEPVTEAEVIMIDLDKATSDSDVIMSVDGEDYDASEIGSGSNFIFDILQ